MSEENVEFIHQGYDAMNRRDFDAALSRMHPEVVWENDPGGPEGATKYVGRAEVRGFWNDFLEVWDRFRFEVLEAMPTSPDLVVVRTRLNTWMRGADDPVSMVTTYLWTIREGQAVRVRLFFDHTAAFEAAGLSK